MAAPDPSDGAAARVCGLLREPRCVMNAAYALRAFHVSPQDSQEPGFDGKSGTFSVTACPAVSTGKPRRMHRGTRNPRKENLMFVKPVFGSLVAAGGMILASSCISGNGKAAPALALPTH